MSITNDLKRIELRNLVAVHLSPRGGRGVFACFDIAESVCIDFAYSWVLTPNDLEQIDRTSIEGFWFDHPRNAGWGLFPLGTLALVNHSIAPNAKISWEELELGFVGYLVAISRVASGREILVDYGIDLPEGWIP